MSNFNQWLASGFLLIGIHSLTLLGLHEILWDSPFKRNMLSADFPLIDIQF
jgi:hypothetical protein